MVVFFQKILANDCIQNHNASELQNNRKTHMNFSETKTPTSRLAGIGFVVALHVLVFYALVSGLAREVVKVISKPIETKLIQEVQLPPPPPPPPPKVEQTPAPQPTAAPVPRIEVQVTPPVTTGPTITATVTSAPVAPEPPAPAPAPAPAPVVEKPHVPVIVAPVLNAAQNCRKPVYPSASRREEEEGTVVLDFLVEPDGSVSQSKVKTSSGYTRLDEAARAALSQCAFKPGTIDGKPHQAWTSMKYTWRLE